MKKDDDKIKKNKSVKNNYVATFTADELFASKEFRGRYQQDFSKIVLGDKKYTIQDAKIILDKFFKIGGNK